MGVLILMRGVPGSGKSRRAKSLSGFDPCKVFSTDEYFERMEGGYLKNWAVNKLFVAHRWNQDRVRDAIAAGVDPVIVDNTNLKMKLVRIYYDMAVEAGYEVRIEESEAPWWKEIKNLLTDKKTNDAEIKKWAGKLAHGFSVCDGDLCHLIKNEHGVPEDTIYNMLISYHPFTVEDLKATSKND